jgi:hypothetical protein
MVESKRGDGADGAPAGAGDDRTFAVNPDYLLAQLAKAQRTEAAHEDPGVRRRATTRVAAWLQILSALAHGDLTFGSRTPVAGAPPWVTLTVMTGGFTTGDLAAGGPIEAHERAQLARIGWDGHRPERSALNAHFLSEPGLQQLSGWLRSGGYRVRAPEEGALLVVVWLLERGRTEQAGSVLREIRPWFDRLRFYPLPHPRPIDTTASVRLQDVGSTVHDLESLRPRVEFERQREAVLVWNPLYDQVVKLFLETVEGPPPVLRVSAGGQPVPRAAGGFEVEGGWPCQRYGADWKTRARGVLDEYDRLRATHRLCHKPEQRRHSFFRLRRYLARCVAEPGALTGRDVGQIRSMLAGIVTRRGVPGSDAHRRLRARQAQDASGPTRKGLASVLAERLRSLPADGGIGEAKLEGLLDPVAPEEARGGAPAGARVPGPLAAVVSRSLEAPLEALVERRVIKSSESLARLVPPVSALAWGTSVTDPDLRRAYTAIYGAFRRRRSLLLFNLESQVKLGELPWVKAIEGERRAGGEREACRRALDQVVRLALKTFPEAILPNKLLQEIRFLSAGAGLALPIVDELAADIFMGEFSEKFLRAAQMAAGALDGTLYARYYDLPVDRLRRIDDVSKSRHGAPISRAFAELCHERAGEPVAGGRSWSPARNGKIIEQAQILTTHNLAVLFQALDLGETLRERLNDLAGRCFASICARLQYRIADRGAALTTVKNCAYAWRQMVFLLSFVPRDVERQFLDWAQIHLGRQRPDFRDRFRPALAGLQAAAGHAPAGGVQARQLLGWSTGTHWLLA